MNFNQLYRPFALLALGMVLVFSSCFNDLNTVPIDEDEITSAVVYDSPEAYKQVLAKLYAGLAVSGQEGPAGNPDINGIDEGFSTYLRQYWKAQELSTDEAVIAWNDGNIHDYHEQDWDSQNEFITAMYYRIYYQIPLCNEFLRETTDEKLDERGIDQATRSDIVFYRAEARFLRALSYWHALDMFRNVPFITEEDEVGSFFPERTTAPELFEYIESELLAVEGQLMAPRQNEYGRADQAAAWMVLAKLYLNAQVYVGSDRNTDCITYCKRILDAGFSLDPDYGHMFMADNHTSEEIIFPIAFDGLSTRTWGGMTFVIHAAIGGTMDAASFGMDGGWGGTRTTSALVEKFPSTGQNTLVAPNEGSAYPDLHVPGSYQGWNPEDENTVIASVNDDGNYEGYLYFAEAGAFKITDGPSWDVAWGDSDGDGILELGGNDISVAEPGFYRLAVNLNDLSYRIDKTEWGLIGSATPGGWDADTDMSYDVEEGAWTLRVDLEQGAVKFRANDGWDLNFGDDGADALLELNGGDISIPSKGTYLFKLYLDKPDYTYAIEIPALDTRAMFHTDGQTLDINDVSLFNEGYAITKYTNVDSDGNVGSDLTFPDTDFPMFRLADVHLMLAEAVVRGGAGSSRSEALDAVNAVIERAYGGSAGNNITDADLTLDFLIDERARELYWECHRRTDLIRFGKFSDTNYLWPLKGGAPEGVAVSQIFDVFPIPSADLGANPNLRQNDGY